MILQYIRLTQRSVCSEKLVTFTPVVCLKATIFWFVHAVHSTVMRMHE